MGNPNGAPDKKIETPIGKLTPVSIVPAPDVTLRSEQIAGAIKEAAAATAEDDEGNFGSLITDEGDERPYIEDEAFVLKADAAMCADLINIFRNVGKGAHVDFESQLGGAMGGGLVLTSMRGDEFADLPVVSSKKPKSNIRAATSKEAGDPMPDMRFINTYLNKIPQLRGLRPESLKAVLTECAGYLPVEYIAKNFPNALNDDFFIHSIETGNLEMVTTYFETIDHFTEINDLSEDKKAEAVQAYFAPKGEESLALTPPANDTEAQLEYIAKAHPSTNLDDALASIPRKELGAKAEYLAKALNAKYLNRFLHIPGETIADKIKYVSEVDWKRRAADLIAPVTSHKILKEKEKEETKGAQKLERILVELETRVNLHLKNFKNEPLEELFQGLSPEQKQGLFIVNQPQALDALAQFDGSDFNAYLKSLTPSLSSLAAKSIVASLEPAQQVAFFALSLEDKKKFFDNYQKKPSATSLLLLEGEISDFFSNLSPAQQIIFLKILSPPEQQYWLSKMVSRNSSSDPSINQEFQNLLTARLRQFRGAKYLERILEDLDSDNKHFLSMVSNYCQGEDAAAFKHVTNTYSLGHLQVFQGPQEAKLIPEPLSKPVQDWLEMYNKNWSLRESKRPPAFPSSSGKNSDPPIDDEFRLDDLMPNLQI